MARQETPMSASPIIRLEGVTKLYGGIAALQSADFELFPGEIHALVGENGAGKSTLCKLIAGVIAPSEGRVSIDGQPAHLTAPKDAARYGISMVYQETSLVPQLTVAQNMVLGRERAFNSVRKVRNAARQVLQRLNFNVDPSQLAGSLSAAKRQMVEIARAVLNDARIIILDEPTAALTPEETDHLFELMASLQKTGVAMIFISHALEEALTHADRITVLRNGRLVKTGTGDRVRSRPSHSPHDRRRSQCRIAGTPRGPHGSNRTSRAAGGERPHGECGQQHVVFDISGGDHRHRRTYRLGAQRGRQSHHGTHQAQLWRRSNMAGRARGPLCAAGAGGGGRNCLCLRGPQTRRLLRNDERVGEHRPRLAREIRARRSCRAACEDARGCARVGGPPFDPSQRR